MGSRVGLDDMVKLKFFTLPRLELQTSLPAILSVAIYFTDCIPASLHSAVSTVLNNIQVFMIKISLSHVSC
jgi:hypothetical protein